MVVASVGLLNLLTAIYVDKLSQMGAKNREVMLSNKMVDLDKLKEKLEEIFIKLDADRSGSLDNLELEKAVRIFDPSRPDI